MKKAILTFGVSALVLSALVFAPRAVDAYRGDPDVQGPNYSQERHEEMQMAFENNDYNSWKELMSGRGRVSEIVNEDNFAKFAEMHRLIEEGNLDGARQIREDLGLGIGMRNGLMHGGAPGHRCNQ